MKKHLNSLISVWIGPCLPYTQNVKHKKNCKIWLSYAHYESKAVLWDLCDTMINWTIWRHVGYP